MGNGPETRLRLAIFLLSAGITSYQLALMQILSYLQWYHFAYLIVSLALLGFGTSGTILSLFRAFFIDHKGVLMPWLLVACGLAMPWALRLSQTDGIRCDFYLLFADRTQIWRLAASSLLYLTPFLLGALAIGLALTTEKKNVGKLYCANLTGSGTGGLFGLALAALFLPTDLPSIIGLAPVAGGLLLFSGNNRRQLIWAVAFASSSILLIMAYPGKYAPSQFKDISRAMNAPDASIVKQIPSPKGLVQVVESSSLRYAPGLSLNYRGEIPSPPMVFLNGNVYGSLPSGEGSLNSSENLLDHTTEVIAYSLLEEGGKALLIQPGGEQSIGQAISHKMSKIVVVEPHGEIFSFYQNLVSKPGLKFTAKQHLQVENEYPRRFLADGADQFELIRLPTVGSFGGTAGIQALSDQFLLTKEFFHLAWNNLSAGGMIMVTCWMDYPVKACFKLTATLAEVLEELGVSQPEYHLAAIRSWGSITFVLKKTPLNSNQTDAIREECGKLFFDPLLLPDMKMGERQIHNLLGDDDFFETLNGLLRENRKEIYEDYAFNLRPATDARPFFYQFLKWPRLPDLIKAFGLQGAPFLELGSLILALNILLLGILALILIILPLFKLGWKKEGGAWTLIYFGSIGTGFMLLEIVLMQKLTLFLGDPLLATATAISGLLFFSGLGSLYSSRLKANGSTLRRSTCVTGLLIILFAIFTVILSRFGEELPTSLLWVFLLSSIAPLGLSMGIPFPIGLRVLEKKNSTQLTWAWGINGCFSVISPALGLAVALHAGFNAVFALAAIAYLLAAGVNLKHG